MQANAQAEQMQAAMGSFLMEQFKKKKAHENKQAQGLGTVARNITDFVKDYFVSEV